MDVNYTPSKSIYDGANYIKPSSPIHKPCPDMAGMANQDPEKLKRSRYLLQKLREKHGLNKSDSGRELNVNALEWENK